MKANSSWISIDNLNRCRIGVHWRLHFFSPDSEFTATSVDVHSSIILSGLSLKVQLWAWDPTWSPVFSSGAPNIRRTRTCCSGSRGEPRKSAEGWNTSAMRKCWESWGCSAWRRERCRETLLRPSSTWRGATRKLQRDFLQGHVGIGQGVMASSWKRVDLD